ncbi:MAG: DUF4956 domain-containing protein [Spirochaetaceae bacterium]|nr:MAG: DUF4956 domain-containing protein [Spirochaetaceae bacterium]
MNRLFGIIFVPPEQILLFLLSLFISILLGLGIAAVYRYTHKGLNYESSFVSTLVLLAPIVCLVMFFIQGELVLSLGLVGSLSIIRFRTPVKDTRDIVFLFWTIAIGLGCGTLHWTYSIAATLIIALLLSLFYLIKYGRQLHCEYILIAGGIKPYDFHQLDSMVKQDGMNVQLRSHELDGDNWEITWEFRFERSLESRIHEINTRLQKASGVKKTSLLTPQLTLPM